MKTKHDIENDVNQVIMTFYSDFKEKDLASIIFTLIKQYSIDEILENLESRNGTAVINELYSILKETKEEQR